ncbi:hypothetical protein [Limosilactobacillus reuteri]|uniref:hypothetical protein n=1 Tax=Limosilactobacillus reuteri TaxID=1598 RepID=UPI001C5A8933|nr:hypothetical protein [Limosilactobacillus reuteri]MBW3350682.1 hypothetical protein [Limosilactobacillus reuteri]UUW69578.1 hypothetical protein NUJ10_11060 [Limosilactobacillus reuteri]
MKLATAIEKINELDGFRAIVEGRHLFVRQTTDNDWLLKVDVRSVKPTNITIDESMMLQTLNDGALTVLEIVREYLDTSIDLREVNIPARFVLPLGVDADGDKIYLNVHNGCMDIDYGSDRTYHTQEELDAAKKQFPALVTLIEDIKKEEE